LGEFNTATIRFLNPAVGIMDEISDNYPDYLMSKTGLSLDDKSEIQPGETRTLKVKAQDSAWETERLASLVYDPDSHFGGMLFFYDSEGKRHISTVGGSLIPKFI
jgi:methane/ammonia monooxygenase subunit B